MKTEEFISAVRRAWLEQSLERYKTLLKDAPRHPEKDTTWQKHIFPCWDSLNDAQRDGVRRFVRLAMVELISEMFCLVDNVGGFSEYREGFELVYGPHHEKVSGDLLDYFLAAEEDDPAKE